MALDFAALGAGTQDAAGESKSRFFPETAPEEMPEPISDAEGAAVVAEADSSGPRAESLRKLLLSRFDPEMQQLAQARKELDAAEQKLSESKWPVLRPLLSVLFPPLAGVAGKSERAVARARGKVARESKDVEQLLQEAPSLINAETAGQTFEQRKNFALEAAGGDKEKAGRLLFGAGLPKSKEDIENEAQLKALMYKALQDAIDRGDIDPDLVKGLTGGKSIQQKLEELRLGEVFQRRKEGRAEAANIRKEERAAARKAEEKEAERELELAHARGPVTAALMKENGMTRKEAAGALRSARAQAFATNVQTIKSLLTGSDDEGAQRLAERISSINDLNDVTQVAPIADQAIKYLSPEMRKRVRKETADYFFSFVSTGESLDTQAERVATAIALGAVTPENGVKDAEFWLGGLGPTGRARMGQAIKRIQESLKDNVPAQVEAIQKILMAEFDAPPTES